MIFSHLIVRHPKTRDQRFAPGIFIGLLVAFILLGQTAPVVGLAGMGTVMILAGALVEFNRLNIWENYRKTYRKQKGLAGVWTKPDPIYYTINVVVLWPLIIVLGFVAVWAAYTISMS